MTQLLLYPSDILFFSFLDKGSCSQDGVGCPIVEINLNNEGTGANQVDISLIDKYVSGDVSVTDRILLNVIHSQPSVDLCYWIHIYRRL